MTDMPSILTDKVKIPNQDELSALTAVPTTTSRDLFAGSSTDVDSRLRGQAAERRLVGVAVMA